MSAGRVTGSEPAESPSRSGTRLLRQPDYPSTPRSQLLPGSRGSGSTARTSWINGRRPPSCPGRGNQGPRPAVVSREVDPAAPPAAEPLDGLGKPEEIPELLRTSQEGTSVAGDLSSGDLPTISDQAWQWMEPLLPPSTGRRGRRWRDHRQVVEAICWKYRTGSTWRELPARFGPWQTAYERLARWSADGTWARLLARAQTAADASGELDWLVAVNSTLVRVHKRGASARRVGGKAATASPDDPQHGEAA